MRSSTVEPTDTTDRGAIRSDFARPPVVSWNESEKRGMRNHHVVIAALGERDRAQRPYSLGPLGSTGRGLPDRSWQLERLGPRCDHCRLNVNDKLTNVAEPARWVARLRDHANEPRQEGRRRRPDPAAHLGDRRRSGAVRTLGRVAGNRSGSCRADGPAPPEIGLWPTYQDC